KHHGLKKLVAEIDKKITAGDFKIKHFVKTLPDELQQLFAHVYLDTVPPDSPVTIEAIRGIIIQTKRLQIKEHIHSLREEIAELENKSPLESTDQERLALIQKQVSELIQRLHSL